MACGVGVERRPGQHAVSRPAYGIAAPIPASVRCRPRGQVACGGAIYAAPHAPCNRPPVAAMRRPLPRRPTVLTRLMCPREPAHPVDQRPRTPVDNAVCDAFNGSLGRECLTRHRFASLRQAATELRRGARTTTTCGAIPVWGCSPQLGFEPKGHRPPLLASVTLASTASPSHDVARPGSCRTTGTTHGRGPRPFPTVTACQRSRSSTTASGIT